MAQQYQTISFTFDINDWGTHGDVNGYLGKLNKLLENQNIVVTAVNAQLQAGDDAAAIKSDIIQIRDVDITGLVDQARQYRDQAQTISLQDITGADIDVNSVKVQGQYVYHPGNKPTPAAIGALAEGAQSTDSYKLRGYAPSSTPSALSVALRDSQGDVHGRLFRSSYANASSISGALAFRVNDGADNYIRFCSDQAAIRKWLGTQETAHYYDNNGGSVSVDLSTAQHHIVQLWGNHNYNVNLSGGLTKGQTLTISHGNATLTGSFTVSGKNMYIPDGSGGTSHTYSAGGWVKFACFNGGDLMAMSGGNLGDF